MSLVWFPIAVLGVWRVTHLLVAENGPWDMLSRLRAVIRSRLSVRLLDCFYCTSLWVSVPFAFIVGSNWLERGLLWPALSGGAIVIEQVTIKLAQPPPAAYFENPRQEDDHDVMLRK